MIRYSSLHFRTLNIFILIILSSISFYAYSSNQVKSTTDSLIVLLNNADADTSIINISNEIAWKFRKINRDSSLHYAHKALDLSLDKHFQKGALKSYNILGTVEYMNSDFIASINNFKEALDLSYELNDMDYVAKMSNNIGTLYKVLGQFNKSLKYNLKSLELKEENHDTIGIVNSLVNIGNLYYQLNKFEEGIEISKKGIELAKTISSNKLSLFYNIIGTLETELGNYENAIIYLDESLKINIQNNDEFRISNSYQNLANVYVELKDFEAAMSYYDKTLDLKLKLKDQKGIPKTEMAIGILAYEMGDFLLGIKHLENARNYYEKTGQSFELKSIYDFLAKSYSAINQNKNAYHFLSQSYMIRDSLYSIESKAIIEELETQYETNKKDLLIKKQEVELSKVRAAIRFYIILGIILIIGTTIIILLISKKQRINKKLAEKNFEIASATRHKGHPKSKKHITEKQQKIYKVLADKMNTDLLYTDINLTIESLAKEIGTNRTELSELINLIEKKNYPAYINELRIKHAVLLMTETNQKFSLGGVAKESGFKSESNFYKQFKLITGLKPIEYLKQQEKKV